MSPFHQLRVLQISDLHERVALDSMSTERKNRVRGGGAGRYRVLEGSSINESLKKIQAERKIDIVCFTGDVADWGLKEEYSQAAKRLDAIMTAVNLCRERLFLVPGNHDVNRNEAQKTWSDMRPYALQNQDTASKYMAGERKSLPGGRPEWREEIVKRTTGFWQWVQEFRYGTAAGDMYPRPQLGYRLQPQIPGLPFPVHIIGLDSAWLAGDENDPKKLLLTDRQVDLGTTDNGTPLPGLKLALVHHPLSDLADGQACGMRLKRNRIDLLLHGHQHEAIAVELKEAENRPRTLAAGSLFEGDAEDKYINNFNVIDIFLNEAGTPLRFDIQFWGWSADTLCWDTTKTFCEDTRDGRRTWWTETGKKSRTDESERGILHQPPVNWESPVRRNQWRHKVVAFDLDGTLIRGNDFDFSWEAVWRGLGFGEAIQKDLKREYRQRCQSSPTRANRVKAYQDWCDKACNNFKSRGLTRSELEVMAGQLKLTNNCREALDELRQQGVVVAIISGGINTFLEDVFSDYRKYVDFVFINELVFTEAGVLDGVHATSFDFQGKVEALDIVCRRIGCTKESEAAFIGDRFNDKDIMVEVHRAIAYPARDKEMQDVSHVSISEDNLKLVLPHILTQ